MRVLVERLAGGFVDESARHSRTNEKINCVFVTVGIVYGDAHLLATRHGRECVAMLPSSRDGDVRVLAGVRCKRALADACEDTSGRGMSAVCERKC